MRLVAGFAVALSLASTACAPMYGPAMHRAGVYGAMHSRRPPAAPAAYLEPLPVGRWDNVMMLGAGTPLLVLTADGRLAEGPILSASTSELRIETASGPVAVPAVDVVRVDRAASRNGDAVSNAARGAAVGLGAVGVLGLLAGKVPPPRLWAAGGIVGGYANAQAAALAPGSSTVYIAENITGRPVK